MSPVARSGLPAYCLHRASGLARVIVNGRHTYLGPYGSEESKARYQEICRQILAERGRVEAKADAERRADRIDSLSIAELVARYLEHARGYYRKHGRQTSEYLSICASVRPVRERYPDTLAVAFGPMKLKEIRKAWIEGGIVREQVNARVDRIRRMYRWAVGEELIPSHAYEALKAVAGLSRGRTPAKEGKKILPVADEHVDATLPHLNRHVRAMVEIQRLTGMRPGEVVLLRTCDLVMGGDVWEFRPCEHKTEHHDRERIVILGPRAIELLKPWLRANREEYLFSAAEAEAEWRASKRTRRATPVWPSHAARYARDKANRPRKPPGARYEEASYRRAITKGIAAANRQRAAQGLTPIPSWLPNQLRHSVATRVERMFSMEHAKSCLGHTSTQVTAKHYVAQDLDRAREAMRKIG